MTNDLMNSQYLKNIMREMRVSNAITCMKELYSIGSVTRDQYESYIKKTLEKYGPTGIEEE